jgi:hypothetical protein
MAWPVLNPQVPHWFETITNNVTNLRSFCTMVQSGTVASAAISASDVLNLANAAVQYKADLALIVGNTALMSQLVTYAQQTYASAIDIKNEATAVNALCTALLTAVAGEYPHNAQGRLLDRTFDLTNGLTWITLTAAQMPNTMTAIANLLAEL